MAIGAIATGIDGARPEQRRRRIDPGDVDEDARPEPASPPGSVVVVERELVPRPAGDVVERGGVHGGPRQRLEVGEGHDRCGDRTPGIVAPDYHARMDGPLHHAAAAGDLAAIAAALADGADVDGRGDGGRTPLLVATRARQPAAFRALLAAGADVDLQDDQLDNPFLYAGAEGILDILRLANEAGADPSITNRYGGIALIPASNAGTSRPSATSWPSRTWMSTT